MKVGHQLVITNIPYICVLNHCARFMGCFSITWHSEEFSMGRQTSFLSIIQCIQPCNISLDITIFITSLVPSIMRCALRSLRYCWMGYSLMKP